MMHLFKLNTILCGVLLVLSTSCKENDTSSKSNMEETTTTLAQKKGINLTHLLGNWKNNSDTTQQFSLYNDGSVEQQNMENLALKDWTLEDEFLVFARKNSSGEQTNINQERYAIIALTAQELILAKDGDTITYKKQ